MDNKPQEENKEEENPIQKVSPVDIKKEDIKPGAIIPPKNNAEDKSEDKSEDKPPIRMTQVPTEKFDALMTRLEKLERKGTTSEEIIAGEDEDREYYCRIKTHKDESEEERPVTRVEDVIQESVNQKGESIMTCTLITAGKDGKEKSFKGVDYAEFCSRDAETCLILDSKTEKLVIKGNLVDEKIYDDAIGKMRYTGRKVRLTEKINKIRNLIQWRDEKVWLDEINA